MIAGSPEGRQPGNTVFASFPAADDDLTAFHIQVLELEPCQLRAAQAGAGEQGQQGGVAARDGAVVVGGFVEEGALLAGRQRPASR